METLIGISATAFQLPEGYAPIHALSSAEPWPENVLQIPKLKGLTLEEIQGVHVFQQEPEGALALTAIEEVLQAEQIRGEEIALLIDYSAVSRDVNGISLCYKMQRDIQAHDALTLAIGNGSCISLQLALQTAVAFMRTHPEMRYALMFGEDRVRGRRFQAPFNVLGDGASALLLKWGAGSAIVDTAYTSIGRFCRVLGIQHWEDDNFNVAEFENKIVPLHYRVIQNLVSKILERQGLALDQIDLILYQNMSLNDYRGLAAALSIPIERIYTEGLKDHGHVLGSDLVINLSMARAAGRLQPGNRVLLISSGAGFSWGVTLLQT